jgi:predicted HD phosphohydrolase
MFITYWNSIFKVVYLWEFVYTAIINIHVSANRECGSLAAISTYWASCSSASKFSSSYRMNGAFSSALDLAMFFMYVVPCTTIYIKIYI